MTDKMITGAYRTLSIAVWGATMALLIFVIVLFCSGHTRKACISLKALTVEPASETDDFIISKTDSIDEWYRADYQLRLTGSRYSPYIYTAKEVVYNPSGESAAVGYFLRQPASIKYSAFCPCDFTLTMYIKCDSAEDARTTAENASFGLSGVRQNFSFFYAEINSNLPVFEISRLIDAGI